MDGAKKSYKIPYDLDESYLDMNIALQTKDGSVGKVLPMKVIMSYVGSLLTCMFLLLRTFIGSISTMPQKVFFVLLWVAFTILLASYDSTRRMNAQLIPVLLNYLPKRSRVVYTRSNRLANGFYSIAGIDSVDEDGLIKYSDGTYGYMYRVVGTASILLFDSDRDAIIKRVDTFFQKWSIDSEIAFLGIKEAQKVYRQVSALQSRYANLKNDDKDLRDLAEEQFKILRDYVGKDFKSIHQYMLIKSNNMEMLRVAHNLLQSEVENSNLMIKQCVPLDGNDVLQVLSIIYKKAED